MSYGPYRIFLVDSAPGDARPVLLLIHGFPTASWDFAPIWAALTEHFRVVTADMLGFGFSSKPRHNHTYSIMSQADLMEAVLAHLAVDHYQVLAHDYGDTVAQELLARDRLRQQPRILSACLLNGGLFPETHRPRPVQRLMLSPLGGLAGRFLGQSAFNRSMGNVFGPDTPPSRETLEGFWRLVREKDGHRLMHKLIRYMVDRRVHRERWLQALTGARCPLALINGSADPVSGAHMVARYRELVGETFIAELPGIGHYPQLEAPDQVLSQYRRFLREAKLPGSSG
ncbi:MAG: alpha/beta hydrolase [Oleiphilaceae bacterium]|nr:alpha/beta hydrolase [Oleiphilaceae bacterium]